MSNKFNGECVAKGRNAIAEAACFRKAGPMKDRRATRGGAKNNFLGFMNEYEEDLKVEDELHQMDYDE